MSFYVATRKRYRQRVRWYQERRWPLRGQTFEVYEVEIKDDTGARKWMELERIRRPDLDQDPEHQRNEMRLYIWGDESPTQIEDARKKLSSSEMQWDDNDRPTTDWKRIIENLDDLHRHYANNHKWFTT